MNGEKITVEVTEDDIRRAETTNFLKRDRSRWCPIARALRRTVGDTPEVEHSRATFTRGKRTFAARLPTKAKRFITQFDNHAVAKPTTLTLYFKEVPNEP